MSGHVVKRTKNFPKQQVGMLSFVLLPLKAKNYKRKSGMRYIILPTEFEHEGGEEVVLYKDGVIKMGEVVRTLQVLGRYPDLEKNEYFVVTAISVADGELKLAGQVIEDLEEW